MNERQKETLPPQVQIRFGTPDDIPEIQECLIDSWVMHARNVPSLLDEERMRSSKVYAYYQEAFAGGNSVILVAEHDGVFAGFIRGDIKDIEPFFTDNRVLSLDDVYVKEPFRRMGIARALVQRAEEEALKRGITHVQAERVYSFNEASQELLASMGYTIPYVTFDKSLKE